MVFLWGLPEILVRLAAPPLDSYRAILFGDDPRSPLLFVNDPYLYWKLRPRVDIEFLGGRVRTNSEGMRGDEVRRGVAHFLCLGDSTPFGWRVAEEESFPARLEEHLGGRGNALPWHGLNAGVPGYSSHQVRVQATSLIERFHPQVVIVCIGNNESWPVRCSDAELEERRRLRATIESIVGHSHFLLWLKEQVRPQHPQPFTALTLENAVPRVEQQAFMENLKGLVRTARQHGAQVILLAPPAYLQHPPVRTALFGEWDEWARRIEQVANLASEGDLLSFLNEIEEHLQSHAASFFPLWLKGTALTRLGRVAEGKEALEQAFERQPFLERSKRSYRDAVLSVALEEEVLFRDINDLFVAAVQGGVPDSLYLDWCHPSAEGHRRIAEALVAWVGCCADQRSYRAHVHDSLGLALANKGRWEEALAHHREALRARGDDPRIVTNDAVSLLALGEASEAVARLADLVKREPGARDARLLLAWVLSTHEEASLRNGVEAMRLLETAEAGREDSSLLRVRAAVLAEVGRSSEAVAVARAAASQARASGWPHLAARIEAEEQSYCQGVPWRTSAMNYRYVR
ncbi:MAG: GDSL-type esterase/lipase family protein [Planctomycetota bacterium]